MKRLILNKTALFSSASRSMLLMAAVVLAITGLTHNAGAFEFDFHGINGEFSSQIGVGASWRVESRDYDLVGKSNQPQFANDPTTTADDAPIYGQWNSGVVPNGAWSTNGDDGNLNFDTGLFSLVLKGTHELELEKDGFGAFTRFAWFYDYFLMTESNDMRVDIMDNNKIRKNHGQDFYFLDYFLFGSFDAGPVPVSARLGNQVVNWGESMFMRHGINVSNPIDASKLRIPGAELKEGLMPQGAIWTSLGLLESLDFQAYYQYEWEATKPDSPGTYFSTSDVAGPGGDFLQLAYAQLADYHGFDHNAEMLWLVPGVVGLPKYMVCPRKWDDDPSNGGQYGVKFDWYAEFLNETEFGFYHANYHSHTPMVNIYAHDGMGAIFMGQSDGMYYQLKYVEDVKLYGFSFNTLLPGGVAMAGEIAYRKDEPYQIDVPEVIYKGLEPVGLAAPGTSQLEGSYAPGELIQGYIKLDSVNYEMNFTKIFNNILGAEALTLVGEVGVTQILDMPNQKKLRLETPGTDRSGNEVREGDSRWVGYAEAEGVTDRDFADDVSWGYVALARMTYSDLFWGVNVSPLFSFAHDVHGTAPSSAGTFIEGRKKMGLKVGFDYKKAWFWDVSYNMYFGGDGNGIEDRDYVSFNLKYSF
ncbi:MAG: DUF1302 domain-containing protein [Desulfobacterales bacterium]|nr:DUF1302 domain-containing protein [Desulfobacterales bacterium]